MQTYVDIFLDVSPCSLVTGTNVSLFVVQEATDIKLSLRKPTRGQIQRGILVVNETVYVR
jgi:hypothetical protein